MCAFYFILRIGFIQSLKLIQIWFEIQNGLQMGKRVKRTEKGFLVFIWHWAKTQSSLLSAQSAISYEQHTSPRLATLAHLLGQGSPVQRRAYPIAATCRAPSTIDRRTDPKLHLAHLSSPPSRD
jgi:hypothetical protein